MKKKIITALFLTAVMTTSVYANQIFIGPDTEMVVTYENGQKVITLIFDPAKTPEWMKQQMNESNTPENGTIFTTDAKKEVAKLTEPPKEGVVLANIECKDENGNFDFTPPYKTYSTGQCTWYIRGRFDEVYGIKLPYMGSAKMWLEKSSEFETIMPVTDIYAMPDQSIAVFAPKYDDSKSGHVCFIKYVERDKNGKPVTVYYSDANGRMDTKKNKYTSGVDGKVIKMSFDEFKESGINKLIGYVVTREVN